MRPSWQSIRINTLWFASLVCALVSALIGILVKQWLREYMTEVSLPSRDIIRLRQHRFDGLVAWNVPGIMAFLPILLELSLILFFAGLVDFLFALQPIVAGVVTSIVGISLLFYIVTAITPAFSRRCPFKSPQSWVAIYVCKVLISWIHQLRSAFDAVDDGGQSWITRPRQLNFKSWGDRDIATVQARLDGLDLKAMTWVQTTYIDHADVQDSLASIIQDLSPENANALVFGMIARKAHFTPAILMEQVRSRSCSHLLRDAGRNFDKRSQERTVRMLLKLLRLPSHPRDHDPSRIGRLDMLWTLWEFSLGASKAEKKIPSFVVMVLDGVTSLIRRSEPFPLRRAALNLLCEGTLAIPHSYYPPDMGSIILFAKDCYRQNLRDLFMKACAVILFPHGIVRREGEYHKQQLRELLRNLSTFLVQCNEDGAAFEGSSADKLVSGLSALVDKEPSLVEPALLDALLEGIQLGLLQLSQKEHLLLQGMLKFRVLERPHGPAQQAERHPRARPTEGAAA
ncbi:hypothetical protein GSI_02149 [Ganoderma sinense ZZ0214-1]|uniref:DUF6535 domain-containing protein n=1 Tax=Ganoderma sinense ZZ0214-1 TaxID=1077348 RepID=A0A2G8SNU1_9APHY|nr:hypothetical protein GSI_02149 [Ganoderma sinense ZZ0214-1]